MRFEVIERLAEIAEERDVDFVVVAGDVFDANTVDRNRVVIHACERMRAFDVPVYLLPGNHDHLGAPNAVLTSRTFETHSPEGVEVIAERKPKTVAQGEAVLLPAPLLRRHERGETTEHLTAQFGADAGEVRIGLAHGSVEAFGEDLDGEATNLVDPERVERADLDYLALGDWHGTRQIDERVWYSGTPEPDNYLENDSGQTLVVEIDGHGAAPEVDAVRSAQLEWRRMERLLESKADVEAFEREIDDLSDPLRTVLELRYRGALPIDELTRFESEVLEPLEGRLLELRARGELSPRVALEDFDVSELEGFVATAARRLLAAATPEAVEDDEAPDRDEAAWSIEDLLEEEVPWEGVPEPDETSARALQLLHRLVHHGGET